MKFRHVASMAFWMALTTACTSQQQSVSPELSLKDAVGDQFLIGVALNTRQTAAGDSLSQNLVKRHFTAIVPENCMKMEEIHPEEDRYDFSKADELVNFGISNGLVVTGHCLIWHSQLAPWFCVDKDGKPVSAEVLKERMKEHIYTVVKRYKGKIRGWDVVNEAIIEDGSYRKSPFYEILGEEFIPLAFQYAHEADPDAELYYNDYGMDIEGRRNGVVKLIRTLKERGLRIDAVGMQGHMGMDHPDINEFEKSMVAFAAEGVKVMITEWDMSALPTVKQGANIADTLAYQAALNPYTESLPDSVSKVWNTRMKQFFQLFEKHADVITRVTAWGLTDNDSWKNDFPIKGRTDYPLLFDRNYQPKPFVKELMEEASAEQPVK